MKDHSYCLAINAMVDSRRRSMRLMDTNPSFSFVINRFRRSTDV
jgi:hypothetical protein